MLWFDSLPWGCSLLAGNITEERRKGHVAIGVEWDSEPYRRLGLSLMSPTSEKLG